MLFSWVKNDLIAGALEGAIPLPRKMADFSMKRFLPLILLASPARAVSLVTPSINKPFNMAPTLARPGASLSGTLTVDEFNDLIAYLGSMKE